MGPWAFGSLLGSLGLWNLWVSISLWVYGSSSGFPVSLSLSFFQAWFTNTNVLIPGKNLNIVKLFIGSPSCSIKSFIMLVIKFINAEKVCKNTLSYFDHCSNGKLCHLLFRKKNMKFNIKSRCKTWLYYPTLILSIPSVGSM